MATPAAILSMLVQVKGVSAATADLDKLDRAAKNAGNQVDDAGKKTKNSGKNYSALKAGLVGLATGGIGVTAGKLVELASDAEETASKFRTVFGKETKSATKELDNFSKATGTSKFALRDQAAQFQALIKPMGVSTKNAAGMSTGMTKLATDLASFNNTSVKEAVTALQSGLVGEAEPLRKFGVQLSATRVEAFAYAKGIAKQGQELTAAQKAQASYAIIMQDTKLAQGDAVKTADSFANQWKRLKNQVTDTATEFAIRLLPIVAAVVGAITSFIGQMKAGEGAGGTFVAAIGVVVGAFKILISTIGTVINFFKEHQTVAMALGTFLVVLGAIYLATLVPAIVASTAALVAQAAAWLLVNAAMLLNPFVLIAVAIAAFVAALVIAYRESETFRAIVTAVWEAIRVATVAVWGFIKAYLLALWSVLKTVIGVYFEVYSTIITTAWRVVKAVTIAVWNAIETALTTVWNALRDAARAVWNVIENIITGAARGARDVLAAVWGTIKEVAIGAWNGLKEAARLAWDGIKAVILTPIREARDAIGGKDGIWDQVKTAAEKAWTALKTGVSQFATDFKNLIVGAFKGAAGQVVDFVNTIIDVINKIPGVEIDKVDKKKLGLAEGGVHGGQGFARGGAYKRTGGFINRPMTFMGEEAPRHPEYVIPTNPAYRGRAQGLLGQAAQAIGLAVGGTFSSTSYGPPWGGIQGGGVTATGVDLRGNPHIFGVAVDPSVIGLGSNLKINPNPFGTDNRFKAFDTGGAIKGKRIDFYDWRGRDAQLGWGTRNVQVNGGGSPGGGIGGLIGGALGAVGGVMGQLLSQGASYIIGKLPGTGDLPGWLHNTGDWILGKAKSWIKEKVAAVVGAFGGGGGGNTGGEIKKGDSLQDAIKAMNSIHSRGFPYVYGGGHGSFSGPYDCSGLVSALLHAMGVLDSPITTDGLKNFGMPGPGKQVTIGVRGSTGRNAHTMIQLGNRYAESGSGHGARWVSGWSGSFPIKRHPGGFAMGGKWAQSPYGTDPHFAKVPPQGWGLAQGGMFSAPYVGAYATGGVVPRDGFGYLHAGETVVPGGAGGGPLMHVEQMVINQPMDFERELNSLAFRLEMGGWD